jgi:hypothetical protein
MRFNWEVLLELRRIKGRIILGIRCGGRSREDMDDLVINGKMGYWLGYYHI